ncbi:MAG: MinD/ParA family protein [Bacillota bacterium]|jgi:flagellar biosynthesis protein FlhG
MIKDQATKLRELARSTITGEQEKEQSTLRIITVASGKGGVGKTNVILNLAIALAQRKQRVVILDADLGLANIDVLMGIVPVYTLNEVLIGRKSIKEILVEGPYNIKIIPGGSGIQELTNITIQQQKNLMEELHVFEQEADYLFVDTGGGINKNILGFLTAADEVIIVVTPEPTSITDAYTVIKILSQFQVHTSVNLIVNRVANTSEAQQTLQRIKLVAEKYLPMKIKPLGYIFDDRFVIKAVKSQQPLLTLYPYSSAAANFEEIARNLLEEKGRMPRGVKSFVKYLVRLLR